MSKPHADSAAQRWARLRFVIVGPLLAALGRCGQLHDALGALAAKSWSHPISGVPTRFAISTVERWYYQAKNERHDPLQALQKRPRKDAGTQQLTQALRQAVLAQHRQHPSWSFQLHHDNLCALAAQDPTLAPVPSYTTVRRFMQAQGLFKGRPRPRHATPGQQRAAERLEQREVRSFEATQVNALWHLDFHLGSRRIVGADGQWYPAHLLGILDDRSRLCAHLQWYLDETAQSLIHGLGQALQKRQMPRALMSDNGAAMLAEETVRGLETLGIVHETTLPYSPYQNGKQEVFWAQVEGRLMAMLEGVDELNLELLNRATQAWVELEYNKKIHQALATTPLKRYLEGPDIGRPSPDNPTLRNAFRTQQWRSQRRSDGTVSIEGRRFEIPAHYRTQRRVLVRYARFDLAHVHLVHSDSGHNLAPLYPLDKQRNADRRRRTLTPREAPVQPQLPDADIAPLLKSLMRQYAATGLPPAYLAAPRRDDLTQSATPDQPHPQEHRS
jgi:transposase InsO family protein